MICNTPSSPLILHYSEHFVFYTRILTGSLFFWLLYSCAVFCSLLLQVLQAVQDSSGGSEEPGDMETTTNSGLTLSLYF